MGRFSIRFHIHLLGLIFLCIAYPVLSETDVTSDKVANKNSGKTILILGDSLSAAYGMPTSKGWVALLQKKLRETSSPYGVVNASITGETTSGGSARISSLISQYRPDILVLQLGGNDGLRGKSVSHIQGNLEQIIIACKNAGVRVLLVGLRLPPNYGTRYTERFIGVYKNLATKHRVPLVPQLLKGVDEDLDRMFADGIHPLPETQPRLLANVWSTLKNML